MISKKSILNILFSFGAGSLALYIIHILVFHFFPAFTIDGIIYFYLFLFIITILSIIGVEYAAKKFHPGMTGFAFLGTSLFKMIVSVIYLLPIIRSESPEKTSYVIQFFVIYFVYLFGEVLYLSRKLKK